MNAFPAFFPLAGRRVVVAGEGEAAMAKLRLLEGAPAIVNRLQGAEARDPAAYAGAALAFIALDDEDEARAAAAAARAAHVPVNVVDRPMLCDFHTPAVIDRGEVVIAIGTGGAAPLLAGLLRADLEARVPAGVGALVKVLGQLQDEIRRAFPELRPRRAFLRAALEGSAAQAAMAGDQAQALESLRAALAQGVRAAGALRPIDGSGPLDQVTLGAARALSEADRLVVDPGVDPGVLALARRDAPRIDGATADMAALERYVAEGQRIVWLTGTQASA
jgi:precorrin-2 dehydrogenase/sirohydrochlorin ferrochelatase